MAYLKHLVGLTLSCAIATNSFGQTNSNPIDPRAAADSVIAALDSVIAALAADSVQVDTVAKVVAQASDAATYEIDYSAAPKEYVIKDIAVSGNGVYDKSVLIAYSGLHVGQIVKMPGDEFSSAIKKFWKQGLFSDVKILANKVQGDEVWLELAFKPRPRISDVVISGVKKKDKEDIQSGIGLSKGGQISPAMVSRAQYLIKHKLSEKGYEKAEVSVDLRPDPTQENYQIVYIDVDRKEKIKVHRIHLNGNDNLSNFKAKWAMKDTKEPRIYNIFKSKKFIREKYGEDKGKLLAKYNEKGYRDAEIVADSVVSYKNGKKVDVYVTVNEGKKYYFRNITWTGNTIYSSDVLTAALGIKKGDVYNQKQLEERINIDEDAVSNLYMDNGYLFFNLEPVEINVVGDSIDMEMRIYEGRQAVINNVEINGNTAVYDNVIRRELRTKPGDLFSKTNLQRSARELAATGQFDPEKLDIRPVPHPEDGTVDIIYNLEQKRNDQVELSFGWGSTGVTGSLGFKFTNFSIQNIFNKKSYHPLPQGDGQTLSLSYTTNGNYYNSASVSFTEPWLGGRRPTNFSTTFYWSKQTGVNSYYYNDNYYYSNSYSNYYNYDADPDEYIITLGGAVGIGTRLSWPDDYFTIYGELAYRHYKLKNWSYFDMSDGVANNLNLGVTFARNSLDNPYFTHRGSSFSLSLRATPPYSAFKDNSETYALYKRYRSGGTLNEQEYNTMQQDLYKWVEYYKTELKAKIFTPLTPDQKLVLMTRAEYGFLGYYNKNRRSPFERYYVGGDGTSGTSSTYATTAVAMRGYKNGSLTPRDPVSGRQAGNLYTRLSCELRYPLMLQPTSTIYILAFADAGNAWQEFSDFDPFNLKRSVGVGARIFLPMLGLIGVDYGYGFDEAQYKGDNHSNFHLVIGQEF
ncbi:MAG: BamA/TamA family outer membrane protein [Paludibacteraceae bacterium]|nr:BamA/TamA family outer membrane protein [Paludibacteraceae bacterium]